MALLAACLVAVLAVSWLVPRAGAALGSLTRRLVTVTSRIEPVLVTEYFLLQAVTCHERFGLRCTPMTLPEGRGFVARRPSIDPASTTSRAEARKEISEGLASPSDWLRAAAAAPGAGLFTARYVTSHGWEAWLMLALSMAASMTILFWLVDSALACVVLTPVGAAGVSWGMAAVGQALLPAGWPAPFALLATGVVVLFGGARDLFERSAMFERARQRQWKRRLAEGAPDD